MALPENFDALNDSPTSVPCPLCKGIYCKPTRNWRLTATGIVEQRYDCLGCGLMVIIRYDYTDTRRYVVCNYKRAKRKR